MSAEPQRESRIADLHCHYPMHLFPEDTHPGGARESRWERLRNLVQSGIVAIAAKLANDRYADGDWRVSLKGLEDGRAKLVCSVLYWPPAEFDLAKRYGSPPLPKYWQDVQYQLECVTKEINEENQPLQRVQIARTAADLESKHTVFVHCLEGALQLGPEDPENPQAIDERVRQLAQQGIFYITVAHLFWRKVATNAPAVDLPDRIYKCIFRQPGKKGKALTPLGREVITAMHKYKVAIDITHMSDLALEETLALVNELVGDPPKEKYPIIATHVAMRELGSEKQEYNLTADTVRTIHASGGVVGLIMAQRQLGETADAQASKALVCKQIDAIYKACGNDASAIGFGTDIDGFIKPTIAGVESAADLATLAGWVEDCRAAEGDADLILYGNSKRVIKQIFESREEAFRELGIPFPADPPGWLEA